MIPALSLLRTGSQHAERQPQAAFEVTLWRALAVFRSVTFAYAAILTAGNSATYDHRYLGWVIIGVMGAWSVATIFAYAVSRAPDSLLLAADVTITAGCLLASRWVVGADQLAQGTPTLTITWMACPVVAVAIARGRWWAAVAAVAIGACDLAVRGVITQATVTGTVIMIMAAIAVGHLTLLADQAQRTLRAAAAVEAANRERERLARDIHDSVLQVLALVQRRGAEIGGDAAELGRLAGEQEAALRALVSPATAMAAPIGLVDLRAGLTSYAIDGASVAGPATPVWLPAGVAHELLAAVAAAIENVRRHCPDGVRTWILLEDEPAAVTVTVRDDGPGIAAGRLEQAAAQGRLGVAQSINGRLRGIGATVTIVTAPGEGTELELRVPRSGHAAAGSHR